MWYIQPVADDAVEEALRKEYDQDLQSDGYISNTSRAWSHRPELIAYWKQLIKGIRAHLRLRTYELVVLAAAREMGCKF